MLQEFDLYTRTMEYEQKLGPKKCYYKNVHTTIQKAGIHNIKDKTGLTKTLK